MRSYGSWIKWKGYGKGFAGAGLFVPGSFYAPYFSPKLLKAFAKAVQNRKGYVDVLAETLRNYYGSGVDIHTMGLDFARTQLHRAVQSVE